jgi:uncharacterized surface protein with fasciclin (FAS1) repeats
MKRLLAAALVAALVTGLAMAAPSAKPKSKAHAKSKATTSAQASGTTAIKKDVPNTSTNTSPAPTSLSRHHRLSSRNARPLMAAAVEHPELSIFVSLIKSADIGDQLGAKGPLTVIAPTNAAFDKLPNGTVDALRADKEKLRLFLLSGIYNGDVSRAGVAQVESQMLKMEDGHQATITTSGNRLLIDNAPVTLPDIRCANGTMFEIDTVLMPPGVLPLPTATPIKG